MHIPFVFGIDYENLKHPKYLWIFHKFVDFCVKNNYPIIAQEEYFKSPNFYHNVTDFMSKDYEFSIPKEQTLISMSKYQITTEESKIILDMYDDPEKCWLDLLKNRNKNLEKIIESKIKMIQNDYPIKEFKSIITWVWLPSLKAVCDKLKIPLIQLELSAIRKENYNTTLGYFSFDNKYCTKKIEKEYPQFEQMASKIHIYDRLTLLTMFLKTINIDYLKEYFDPPKYNFGLDLGMPNECFFNTYSKYSHDEINEKLNLLASKDEVLARGHPQAAKSIEGSKKFIIDNSHNSIEWILKCRRIVSSVSNIGFEAMLLGKTSYVLSSSMPFYYKAVKSLSVLEDEIVNLSFLNYLIFCYFAPYELMFDKDYLDFRLSNPSLEKVYKRNCEFILRKINWTKKEPVTQKWILEHFHKLNKEKVREILEYRNDSKQRDLENKLEISNHENIKISTLFKQKENELETSLQEKEKQLKTLELKHNDALDLIKRLNQEIENMQNSKSWKLTKPLRALSEKIRK